MPSISPDSLGKLSSAIRALEGKEIIGDRVNVYNNYRLSEIVKKARMLALGNEMSNIIGNSLGVQRERASFDKTIRRCEELQKEVNLLRDKLSSDKDADVKAALDQLSQSIREVENSARQARVAAITTAKTGGTASAPVQTVQRTVASEDTGDEFVEMATPAPAPVAASEEDTASVSAVAEPARPSSVFCEDRKGGGDSLPPRLPGSEGGADVLPPQAAGSSFNASAPKPAPTAAP